MNFNSIGALVAHLSKQVAATNAAEHACLEEIGKLVEQEAKKLVGQENSEWQALADSTIEEKSRLGYTNQVSATDPELRTGEMRDSYTHFVKHPQVIIGSDSDKALATEFGTSHQPPRPVLELAVHHSIPEIEKIAMVLARRIIGISNK